MSKERRQQLDAAHAKLRERQQTIEEFIQALPAAVLVMNADGTPYYSNRVAAALLGPDVMHATFAEYADGSIGPARTNATRRSSCRCAPRSTGDPPSPTISR